MQINGKLVFDASSASEIDNLRVEKVSSGAGPAYASLPTAQASDVGRLVFATDTNVLFSGYYTGTGYAWQAQATGGSAFSQSEGDAIETTLGPAINNDGTLNAAGFTSFVGPLFTSPTSFTNAINQIASEITGHDALWELTDVNTGASNASAVSGDFLRWVGGATAKWENHTLVLADVTDVTTTSTELNQLAGQGAVAADFAKLHALTASAADINLLTGGAAGAGAYSAGAISSTILSYLGGATPVTSNVQAQLNNKQPLNTGLTNWASFVNGVGTGIVVQTGPNAFADVTISSTDSDLVVTNGNGVAGAPVLSFAGNVAALSSQALYGFLVLTSAGNISARQITGTTGRIVTSNPAGLASDVNIDLATVTQGSTGLFLKFSVDGYGRVVSNTPVVIGDLTALLGTYYLETTGGTMTGNITMSQVGGYTTVTGLPNPTGATDAANKAYVDASASALNIHGSVDYLADGTNTQISGATYAAGTIDANGGYGIGATLTGAAVGALVVDGETVNVGERVLVNVPGSGGEIYNGIYSLTTAGTGAVKFVLTRATDANDSDINEVIPGDYVFVTEGTNYKATGWVETALGTGGPGQGGGNQSGSDDSIVLGTNKVYFTQFSGAGAYSAGTGLLLTGTTFTVNYGAGIESLPSGEVGINLFNTSTGALILTTDGTTRNPVQGSALQLLLPAGSGLTQDATGLYIPAAGVTNAMLANSSVILDADVGSGSLSLGGTIHIEGTALQGISTSVTGSVYTITAANATTSSLGVAQFDPLSFTVVSGAVSISPAGVSNTQLANSTIRYAGTTGGVQTVALGSSFTIVGGSSPITTVSAAGSVTINVADATTAALGLASFNGSQFAVSSGAVSLHTTLGQGGITNVAAGVDTAASGDLLTYNGTNWVNATRATVFGTESIATLSDVSSTTTSSATSGEALIFDNATSKWQNQPIYFAATIGTASTSWVVTHNLGCQFVNVTVYDATNNVVIPQSIVATSSSVTTVTFNTALAGTCVVMGVALH